jgi:hypothetical protein
MALGDKAAGLALAQKASRKMRSTVLLHSSSSPAC